MAEYNNYDQIDPSGERESDIFPENEHYPYTFQSLFTVSVNLATAR